MNSLLSRLEEVLGKGRIKCSVELFSQVTLHTKNTAEYYFEAKSRKDLQKAKQTSLQYRIPLFIIAGGSNIAITKDKINGLVVKNMYEKKELLGEQSDSVDLLVSSGYNVPRLVHESIEAGYSGFESHKGLPGTVGGALYMNSKWTRPLVYFSDQLLYAYVVDNRGEIKKVNKEYFTFSYDYSILHKTHEILLEAVFRLKKESPEILKKKANEAWEYRVKTQPTGISTSGCFFKNISEKLQKQKGLPTRSAGYLIDKAGLKNVSAGSFYVSDKHANFIINKGKGEPSDLIRLLTIIKKRVKQKFNIELEEEVVIV